MVAVMATLVTTDSAEGWIRRYETGGEKARLTHSACFGGPVTFTPNIIEQFRIYPDPQFAVDPPPRPTGPPAGAGTVQRAA